MDIPLPVKRISWQEHAALDVGLGPQGGRVGRWHRRPLQQGRDAITSRRKIGLAATSLKVSIQGMIVFIAYPQPAPPSSTVARVSY
jgi:hypothetical protein